MLIEVTQEDIDKGIRNNCQICPVALAIKSVFVNGPPVFVGSEQVHIGAKSYYLPKVVRNAIFQYDHNNSMSPFSFELVMM